MKENIIKKMSTQSIGSLFRNSIIDNMSYDQKIQCQMTCDNYDTDSDQEIDENNKTKDRNSKQISIKSLDLALISGPYRNSWFNELDEDRDGALLKEDLEKLDAPIFNICQRYSNLVNSDQELLKK